LLEQVHAPRYFALQAKRPTERGAVGINSGFPDDRDRRSGEMGMGLLDSFKSAAGAFSTGRQTAEALVAIMYGVARADGSYGADEDAKIRQVMSALDILKKYPISDHFNFINAKLKGGFEVSTESGLDCCIEELRDVRKLPMEEKAALLRAAKAVASVDGSPSPSEKEFLQRCADAVEVPRSELRL
jgi:tellurite resistance protein